jgi:hypothetical protein
MEGTIRKASELPEQNPGKKYLTIEEETVREYRSILNASVYRNWEASL